MGRVYMVMLCLLHGLCAYGQSVQDSTIRTYELEPVDVYRDRLRAAEVGIARVEMDSLLLDNHGGSSLADVFRSVGGLRLRAYGSNGLSTASFRGTGGSHTAVVWNGFNIQSTLSGQRDLSLIPANFIDDLSIQKGGSTSLYGSGAIGGTIQLNNPVQYNRGLQLSTLQEIGSFGNYFQGYNANWSGTRFASSTRLFSRTLENNYPYTNGYVRPKQRETRQHAGMRQYGLYQQNDLRIGDYQLLGLKLWWQENRLEIPEIILAGNESQAIQRDDLLNAQLSWSYDKGNIGLSYNQSVQWHELHYTDPPTDVDSKSTFTAWNHQIELEWELTDAITSLTGTGYKYEGSKGDALGYPGPDRQSIFLFSSLQYRSRGDQLTLALNAREELVDNQLLPAIFSLGNHYRPTKYLSLRANVSKNYRIPTFNDLYWMGEGGIGNPDLDPENSWNVEVGLDLISVQTDVADLQFSTTVFSSWVEDWILWYPISARQWTPENIKEVWSRGVELSAEAEREFGSFRVSLRSDYSFVRSTNEQVSAQGNIGATDKQLIYTPQHEWSLLLKALYKSYFITANHTYLSQQFTDGENTEVFALPDYHVVDVVLGRKFVIQSFSGTVRFEINNVLDTSYENRRGYPMYGRNYTIGLKLNFNQ